MTTGRTLVVVPSVPAVREGDGWFLDIKLAEGLALYAKLWPGPVRALVRTGSRSAIGYGRSYRPEDLPFELVAVPDRPPFPSEAFTDAAVVLAAGDSHGDFGLAESAPAPLVYIIEYTLATRLRIIALEQGARRHKVKPALWTLGTEWQRRRAFRRAAGLQCNGTPAFDAYRTLTPAPLLYFDTRTRADAMIGNDALAAKQGAIRAGAPLRLAFSGRLEPMKGADHLPRIAAALARTGTRFTLDIYGGGYLRESIARDVTAAGLADRVTLHGPVPFETELIPALIGRTDLFVCPHRQADPSCTYMETLGCGVPIVGYANAAFAGVAALGDIGIATPMDDPAAAARAIATLAGDRPTLAARAGEAARVGAANSFEAVFAARIAHLAAIAGV